MENKITAKRFISGQSILGFIFGFIVVAALAVGITRVWLWFNINYGVRQARYQESRISASHGDSYGGRGNHSYLMAREYSPSGRPTTTTYEPVDLSEQWLFDNDPVDTVPYELPDIDTWDSLQQCTDDCPECVTEIEIDHDGNPETPPIIEQEVDPECPCFVQCLCRMHISPQIEMYDAQIQSMREAAGSMRHEARNLEREADKCDDPWDMCWWAGFGAVKRKLEEAAGQLRREASRLCCGGCNCCPETPCWRCWSRNGGSGGTCLSWSRAGVVEGMRRDLMACCQGDNDTLIEQERCLEEFAQSQCSRVRDATAAELQDTINTLNREINFALEVNREIERRLDDPNIGCPAWAYYRCKYAQCMPAVQSECSQECADDCDTACDAHCVNLATWGDPEEFHEDAYNSCIAIQCVHDRPINYWDVCNRLCMLSEEGGFRTCIGPAMDVCKADCLASPQYDEYYQECCRSFCCSDTKCGFGVFDRYTHGHHSNGRTWPRPRHPECSGDNWQAPGTLGFYIEVPPAEGGILGDHCNRTWNYRYNQKPRCVWPYNPEDDPWPCDPDDPVTDWAGNIDYPGSPCRQLWRCAEAWENTLMSRMGLWWDRACYEPDDWCDEDCEGIPIADIDETHACFGGGWNVDPETGEITPQIAECGLQEVADRQLAQVVPEVTAERDKFQDKRDYAAGCCGGNYNFTELEEDTVYGTCCLRDPEGGPFICLEGEMTESLCQLECLGFARRLGDDVEVEDIFDICPDCEAIEDIEERSICITECLEDSGMADEQCSCAACNNCFINCVNNARPEDIQGCISGCFGLCG